MTGFPFLASWRDLSREHRDRKITHLLLALSLLTAGVLAALRFETATPQATIEAAAQALPFAGRHVGVALFQKLPVAPQVEEGRVVRLKERGERWEFRLRYADPRVLSIGIQNWEDSLKGREPARITRRPDPSLPIPVRLPEEEMAYLRERFESLGLPGAVVRRAEGPVFDVSVVLRDPNAFLLVRSVRILDSWSFPVHGIFTVTDILVTVQKWIVDNVAGFFGICLAMILVGTGFFRSFEKGAVEMILARPVSRPALFLARVAAAVSFFLAHAAFLIGVSSAAIWLTTGFWNGGFLIGVPLAGLLFGVLFPVSALVAVAGRSAALAPVAGLGVWMIATQLDSVYRVGLATLAGEIPAFWEKAARGLYWIFPKTAALKEYGLSFLSVDGMSPEVLDRLELVPRQTISAGAALGTSLLFALAFLGLATWLFSRKEP